MMRTKLVIPIMPDNIWRILETTGANMGSFVLNFRLENYNYHPYDDLRGARQVPKPQMPHKKDGPIELMPTIHMAQPT